MNVTPGSESKTVSDDSLIERLFELSVAGKQQSNEFRSLDQEAFRRLARWCINEASSQSAFSHGMS